jgi:hypothetical protein
MWSVTFQKVTVAQEAGFYVSWPDLLRFQTLELSDEDLEAFAGGGTGFFSLFGSDCGGSKAFMFY